MEVLITFFKTSTTLRRLKTPLGDHAICRRRIYIGFKLDTYYHFITRQTNYINFNKLNMIKHEHNAQFMKTRFSMKSNGRR